MKLWNKPSNAALFLAKPEGGALLQPGWYFCQPWAITWRRCVLMLRRWLSWPSGWEEASVLWMQKAGRSCCSARCWYISGEGIALKLPLVFLQSATNSAKSMEECCEEVAGMYRSAATDWLVRLSIEPPPGAAFKAAQFVVSYRLFHWLQQQNEKGVAPRRRDLVAQALESFPEGMPLESLCKFKHTLRHKRFQNQWLRRFRLQWNARLAKLPVLPPLPLHLRQEKVRCYFAFFLRLFFFPGPRASLLLGSGWGTLL